jgi:hypothetical protein
LYVELVHTLIKPLSESAYNKQITVKTALFTG